MTHIHSDNRILAGLILSCLTLFIFGFSHSLQASASEDNQYITGVSLTDLTNPNADGKFGPLDSMQVKYDFDISKGDIDKNGRDFSVKVPEQFNLQTSFSFDIEDDQGNVIDKAVTDPNNHKINVSWTDLAVSKNSNNEIKGSFNILLHWNLAKITTSVKTPINWDLPNGASVSPNSTNVIVKPATNDDPDEMFSKWGWIDPNDPNVIQWAIRVNRKATHISDAVLNDEIGDNQKLLDISKVIKVHYNSDNGWTSTP
ncbi:hypothetical protein G6R29_05245 [Fructobacillus sp. M2-14]|uniref:Uncharacterized protein n=1 Tax=Fructobacillus broussonetiae TaxID=2713173 RepID=A0ABS5R0Q4_9LACO|nr:Ig-like domain-containing protein [Fructobacillus broussonetiae]MBS9339025.1 hypothetical protein [Fructobacillus broussonetiae]